MSRSSVGEIRRVARIDGIRVAALQLAHEPRDVRQLEGPFHLRMRGQDLLEEGRAGPRQTDNENRLIGRAAVIAPCREEIGRADLFLQTRVALERLDPEAGFRLLQRVAALVVLK